MPFIPRVSPNRLTESVKYLEASQSANNPGTFEKALLHQT